MPNAAPASPPPATEPGSPRLGVIGLAGLIAGFIAFALSLRLPGEEDAYIYFRFAANAAHGFGLSFNPGTPVEGYSSPIWMALLVLATRLGAVPHIFAPLAGVVVGGATLVAVFWLTRTLGGGSRAAFGAATAVATSLWFVIWSRSGLETPAYALGLVVAAGLTMPLLAETPRDSRAAWRAGIALLAVSLLRPDGILLTVAVLALASSLPRAQLLRLLAPSAVGLAVHEAWRYRTFDAWAPNTSIKIYPLHFDRSLPQAAGFLLFAGVVGLVLPAMGRRGAASRPTDRTLWLCALIVSFGFHFFAGGDYRSGFRYLVPAVPLFATAAWLAYGRLVRPWRPAARRALGALLMLAPLAGSIHEFRLWQLSLTTPRQEVAQWTRPITDPGEWGVAVAHWLLEHVSPGETVAYGQMGKAPYLFTLRGHDARFIDTVGWVDREVADLYRFDRKMRDLARDLLAGLSPSAALARGRDARARAFVDQLLARRPEWILIEPHLQHEGVNQLPSVAQFRAQYEKVTEIAPAPPVAVYRRRATQSPEPVTN